MERRKRRASAVGASKSWESLIIKKKGTFDKTNPNSDEEQRLPQNIAPSFAPTAKLSKHVEVDKSADKVDLNKNEIISGIRMTKIIKTGNKNTKDNEIKSSRYYLINILIINSATEISKQCMP